MEHEDSSYSPYICSQLKFCIRVHLQMFCIRVHLEQISHLSPQYLLGFGCHSFVSQSSLYLCGIYHPPWDPDNRCNLDLELKRDNLSFMFTLIVMFCEFFIIYAVSEVIPFLCYCSCKLYVCTYSYMFSLLFIVHTLHIFVVCEMHLHSTYPKHF